MPDFKGRFMRFMFYAFGAFALGINGYLYFRYGYILPKILLSGIGCLVFAFVAMREDTLSF
jgi:hypothetical protein